MAAPPRSIPRPQQRRRGTADEPAPAGSSRSKPRQTSPAYQSRTASPCRLAGDHRVIPSHATAYSTASEMECCFRVIPALPRAPDFAPAWTTSSGAHPRGRARHIRAERAPPRRTAEGREQPWTGSRRLGADQAEGPNGQLILAYGYRRLMCLRCRQAPLSVAQVRTGTSGDRLARFVWAPAPTIRSVSRRLWFRPSPHERLMSARPRRSPRYER